MNKNVIIGLVAVAGLVLGGLAYTKTPDTIVGSAGAQGIQGVKGDKGEKGDRGPVGPQGPAGVSVSSPKLGAVASPDIQSPYFSYGGVRNWGTKTDSLTQATTTVCAIQSPAGTSTLSYGGIRLSVASTTATTVTLAKATTPYATTSRLAFGSIAANAQGTIAVNATSTGTGVTSATDAVTTFAPNTYFVVGMAGGVGTFSPTGVCQATFIEI